MDILSQDIQSIIRKYSGYPKTSIQIVFEDCVDEYIDGFRHFKKFKGCNKQVKEWVLYIFGTTPQRYIKDFSHICYCKSISNDDLDVDILLLCIEAIRKLLNNNFKDTDFSVIGNIMSDDRLPILITWTSGPTKEEIINKIIKNSRSYKDTNLLDYIDYKYDNDIIPIITNIKYKHNKLHKPYFFNPT